MDENGTQLGVLPTFEALRLAHERNLDLVEVAPNAVPPVCRLLDFGKFQYERQKKEREARKAQKIIEIKQLRLKPRTGEHDIDTKVNQARKFLEHKDKVLLSVMFRGRELAHVEEGRRVIDEILQQLEDCAKVESPPAQQGRRIVCTLGPK